MSSALVHILEVARIAEKSKEEAKQYAVRAEVECLKINHQIHTITRVINDGLNNGFASVNKVHDLNGDV